MTDTIVFTYGKERVSCSLPRGRCLGELKPAKGYGTVGTEEIEDAISNPVGLKENIYQIAKKKIKSRSDYLCIVISDHTRNTGIGKYLGPLINALNREGIDDGKIIFQFANGTHRIPTTEEQREKIGEELYERFKGRIYTHNAYDEKQLVTIGRTSSGNLVRINKRVAQATVKLLTGSVLYHYFAGFGGGRKSILAGVSSAETIARNHSLTIDPHENKLRDSVGIGRLEGNPVSEDMQEAASLAGVDYIINTVMAADNTIAAVAAGDLEKAFHQLTETARAVFGVPVSEKADLVIATAKDSKNWVQSHKALYNASRAVREDGTILLLARCPEGIGSERLEHWLGIESTEDVFCELRNNPEVNGQTAYSTRCRSHKTILVSELGPDKIALLRMTAAKNMNEAVNLALKRIGNRNFSYYIMPEACYTVPLPV